MKEIKIFKKKSDEKTYLGILLDENCEEYELTPLEVKLIRFWVKVENNKSFKLPVLIPISERIHLDFFGSEDQDNVLVCTTTKRMFK